jgi:hypothetical protein
MTKCVFPHDPGPRYIKEGLKLKYFEEKITTMIHKEPKGRSKMTSSNKTFVPFVVKILKIG